LVQAGKLFARRIPLAVLMGLALAAPARAQDFADVAALEATADTQEIVDVAALEAGLEAAEELADPTTEPDPGDTGSPESLPTASVDAAPVPVAAEAEPSAEATEVRSETTEPERYQAQEPQYHAEYHAPEPSPVAEDRRPTIDSTALVNEAARAAAAPVTEAARTVTQPAQTEPVAQSAPVQTEPAQAQTRATQPDTPATSSPAPEAAPPSEQPAASATPTIWIWIWNWTWTTVEEGRYQNDLGQYQIDETILGTDVAKSVQSTARIPVQIGLPTGVDIVREVQRDIAPVETVREAVREVSREAAREMREATREAREVSIEAREVVGAAMDVAIDETETALDESRIALEGASRPLSTRQPKLTPSFEIRVEASTSSGTRKRKARRGRPAFESAHDVRLYVASSSTAGSSAAHAATASSSASYFASGDVARASRHTKRTVAPRPRPHRVAAPKEPLPRSGERFDDAAAEGGGGVGFLLKTIAILTASMLLAVLGYGIRIWLPETRLRGLLGSGTDPPG
jgi:hypothetical protein